MRYFRHHIGDYAAATAHLSFIEDAAYHRLLRRYYQDEHKLPCEVVDVCRLVGARTRDEKRAVEMVLLEFFTLVEEGWQQVRADAEIELFQKKVQTARDNGKSGGRPKDKPLSSKNKDLGNPEETQTQTQTEPTEKLPTTHYPLKVPLDKSNGADLFPDVSKVIFGAGLNWLMQSSGRPRQHCASLLGKWRKQSGDEALIAALGRAQREGPIDPIAWLSKSLASVPVNANRADWN